MAWSGAIVYVQLIKCFCRRNFVGIFAPHCCLFIFYRAVRESLCKFFDQLNLPKFHPVDWLHALPLLHFVRGNSSPFMDLKSAKNISYGNWKWWGLEGMNVGDIRRCIMDRSEKNWNVNVFYVYIIAWVRL